MALQPQKFREIVFQLLYGRDMGRASEENMVELCSNELKVTKKNVKEAQEVVNKICSKLEEIDSQITQTSYAYTFERIPGVERNILRQAIYDLLYNKTLPHQIVIAEALRLAKKFSTKESASFVNAILDCLYKSLEGKQVDNENLAKTSQALLDAEEVSEQAAKEMKKQDEADEL